ICGFNQKPQMAARPDLFFPGCSFSDSRLWQDEDLGLSILVMSKVVLTVNINLYEIYALPC
ncbi:MAG: hypothetical protein ACYDHA_14230, partial [Bellilinea sp.]